MTVLMPNPVFRWFVPAQNGTGLVPAAGYKAKFYAAGTDTPKTIYEIDDTPYPSPSNTAVLNSEGYAEIKLGEGGYKLVVTDSDDVAVFTQDNISGAGNFGSGFTEAVQAESPYGLADVDTTANRFTFCAGYYEPGDGGHGMFWNETSSTPDDTGYVIASLFDPTKRWFRIPDEAGDVRAASFGYIGSRSGDCTDQLLAACAYCASNNKVLRIGAGDTATIGQGLGTLTLTVPGVYLEQGSVLTASVGADTLVITGRVDGTAEQHFSGFDGVEFQAPQVVQNPEWFGADLDSPNNTAAFALWLGSLPNGGAFILPPGGWNYANTGTFPYPDIPLLLYGTVVATSTGLDIPPGVHFPDDSQFRFFRLLFPNGAKLESWNSGAQLDGEFSATGDISTGSNISADNANITTDVTAGENVRAGNDGAGSLIARAGTSTRTVKSPGMYATVIGSAATSGTSLTELLGTTLYANTLVNTGDRLRIKLAGNLSGNTSGTKLIELYIAATSFASISAFAAESDWEINVDIYKSGSNYVSYWTGIMQQGTGTAVATRVDSLTVAFSSSTTYPIAVYGTAAAGAIVNTLLTIEYWPVM